MASRLHEATRRRVFPASRALVWALVADTNRWDRSTGLAPGRYRWRDVDGQWSRTAVASELGFALEWIEPPYRWVEGRFVHGERRFVKGPTLTGGFKARLDDVEGGTEVVASGYVTTSGVVGAAAGAIMKARFGRALERYLDSIGQVIGRAGDESSGQDEPAVMQARRALMGGYDTVTSGTRTQANLEALEQRARQLESSGVAAPMVKHLVDLLRDRPDEEVAQIRPFELARVWGTDRRDTLSAFLRATVAGLVDLKWQINCPVCRVSASVVSGLAEVGRGVHCEACHIGYDIDFGRHVEAVFQSSPAVRAVDAAVYCASSPAFLPHVYAQLRADPGAEVVDEAADFPAGTFLVRGLGGGAVELSVPDERVTLEIATAGGGLDAKLVPRTEGGSRIRFKNDRDTAATVLVERSGWSADAVLGSVVASFPDFVDLFGTEAPAAGVELSIGRVTLLFSDLTGSTALYQRIGDARAFAVVEQHFNLMDEIVRARGGAIIKTMGDAVMASFAAPSDAVGAAIEMAKRNRETFGEHGLAVRLGVHSGPCLAVRANERLDFFGTTVNMAARLEGKSEPGHVVVTKELAEDPLIAPLLAPFVKRSFEAALKGITAAQELVSVNVAG